ncbi:MAG: hypothetical protein Q9163_002564 [Psora crenata]
MLSDSAMVAVDMIHPPPDGPLPPSPPPKTAHRRLPTANDFPVPAGQPFIVTKRDQGLVSPTQSSFSYTDEENSPHTTIKIPADMGEKVITREIERGTPGEVGVASKTTQPPQEREITKKRSQYYTEVFTCRQSALNPRERVHKGSIIIAEIKTNVIIRDEFLFLNDMSQHLSQRYQRPTSSIFVSLDHSACLLFAGSFDPAYILTISALPSQILPATNKRNAALMQSFLASSLGVLPDRGVIRFLGVPEEYMASAGTTVFGLIERLQKNTSPDHQPVAETEEPLERRPTTREVPSRPPKPPGMPPSVSMPGSRAPSPTFKGPALPAIPDQKTPFDKRVEKLQKIGKRKSLFAMFGR